MMRSLLVVLVLFVLAVPAFAFSTNARNAIVIDAGTRTILLDKNAHDQMFPASMTKLMTAYLLFERLKSGELALDQEFIVSEKAWRMEGSRTFLPLGESVSVENLLKGMVIQSGNDAAVMIAEAIGGSEEQFAVLMNNKAKELGMTNSHFMNASGLPHPEHYSSAHDLAVLALSLIETFPEYYEVYSVREFEYNKIKQQNRNPLLHTVKGADGLKTGYTEEAGYCLVGAAERGGRRLVMVIGGLESSGKRALEARKVMEYAFNHYSTPVYFRTGDVVASVPVWLGKNQFDVPLMASSDVLLTMPTSEKKDVTLSVDFNGPLYAPLQQGQPAGTLKVNSPRFAKPVEFPLFVGRDVEKVGFFEELKRKLGFMLTGDLAAS